MRVLWYIGITFLVFLFNALAVSSPSNLFSRLSKDDRLWEDTSAMHEISVNDSCGVQITVVAPKGAAYDLYAEKRYTSPGTCPT